MGVKFQAESFCISDTRPGCIGIGSKPIFTVSLSSNVRKQKHFGKSNKQEPQFQLERVDRYRHIDTSDTWYLCWRLFLRLKY